ncbi:uncharacterized protein LOC113371441 [Ctenocephalides felis]|uniref:uncharacterized protein LOC113371441 n=1 Tax=Ctenocephalides felis TaxID=7515 RepID=UPI000E6E3503|nr:uncharacterized protein LOC113371441 [Ctenocephalides felis]
MSALQRAMDAIDCFDGSSKLQLDQFFCSCTYAFKVVKLSDHDALLDYILYIKIKGKAMQAIQYRKFESFDELKAALEELYLDNRSVSSLQIEFNQSRQGFNESARDFGLRLQDILRELIDATIKQIEIPDSNVYCSKLLNYQALHIFQEGLHNDLKFLIKAKQLKTLELAISAAVEEEKLLNSSKNFKSNFKKPNNYSFRPTSHIKSIPTTCNYCKKLGHSISDCRKRIHNEQSKSKVNIVDRAIDKSGPSTSKVFPDTNENSSGLVSELKLTHLSCINNSKQNLAFVNIECLSTITDRINLLVDTGAEVSLIKLSVLQNDLRIDHTNEDKLKLCGISGNSVNAIGRIIIKFRLGDRIISHSFYVVDNTVPIRGEGILGLDFLKEFNGNINIKESLVNFNRVSLPLNFANTLISLNPRTESVVQVSTFTNDTEIIEKTELKSGVFISNTLVSPHNFKCFVNIVNTNEYEIR